MRVLLADDQYRVRFALRVLLEQQSQFHIVGEAVDATALWAQLQTTEPDMLLLDWGLPGLKSVGDLPALHKIFPDLIIIVLSGRPEAREKALSAGADAFISKVDSPDRLLTVIEACSLSLCSKT